MVATTTKKPKVDNIEDFFGIESGHSCWRSKIRGEDLEFFEALEATMKEKQTAPNWVKVSNHVGISPQTIARHYKGQCSCGR